jgi:hypothetical protein
MVSQCFKEQMYNDMERATVLKNPCNFRINLITCLFHHKFGLSQLNSNHMVFKFCLYVTFHKHVNKQLTMPVINNEVRQKS